MTMSTLFTIRVNDATFPHHGMSGRLDELLRSPGSQPVRCVATAPGHVVVSVAGGKYLHAFSARTKNPSQSEDAATKPAMSLEHPRDAFVTTSQTRRPHSDLEPERFETSSLLSFHGASPVSRVVFVPAGAEEFSAEKEKTTEPLALVAVQEDGGVAAWRWVETNKSALSTKSNETDDENDGKTKHFGREVRGARWSACAPPSFAGGPPLILEPPANAFAFVKNHSRRGRVVDASLVTTLENGRRRVKLACLTSGQSQKEESEESEGTRRSPCSSWLVLIDVCFLDDLCFLDDRGNLRDVGVLRGEKKKQDETSRGTTRARFGKFENRHEALAPVPNASAVLSAGGDEFWVVNNGGGAANGAVATRWAVGAAKGQTRATRRVDLSAAAAAADAAAAAADGVSSRAVAERTRKGRLATGLHYPSRELLAVTDRGNVLCLSPGLRSFDSGTDEARDASASAAEREKSSRKKAEHSVRHVGRLRGFADDFANPAKSWHVSNALVAHGPFLYLAWRFGGSAETRRAGEDAFEERKRDGEPPETDDSYAEDTKTHDSMPIGSAVSAYHLSSGVSLGTVQIPALPALASGAANDARRATGADEKNGTTERTKTLSANAPKRAYDAARLVDGGAFWGPPAFLLATDAYSSAAGVFVVAPAPAAATLARVYVGEDADVTRAKHRRARSSTSFRERVHAEMSCLLSARRECAWFGGSLERLDASLALATAELDIDARARGTPRVSHERLFSDDAEKSRGKNQRFPPMSEETTEEVFLSPTRARVAEPALVLRAREKARAETINRNDDAWRVVADETRAFFRKNYPKNVEVSANVATVSPPSDADAARAFAVFSELGAAEARDVHGALAAGGAAGADADDDATFATFATFARHDVRLTERETKGFARAGLAALDAAASAAAPWASEDGGEKEKQQVAVFEAEGRDALRAVAARARRLGSETETLASISDDVSTRETLGDDFRDVLSFLSSRGDGDGDSSEAPPSSCLEAAAALLATTTTVVASASEEKTRDERDAFASVCVCALAARPRLVVWLVARAAARAARAGDFADARAAARVLAARALAAAPPLPETHAHTAAAESRAALLTLAGHAHAATWLLLTRGAAEDAQAEAYESFPASDFPRTDKERRLLVKTSSRGWGSAARLLYFGGEACLSADLAAGGEVFETLASALRHVARRDALTEKSSDKSASFHLPEAEPATAAAHTLRAAQKLAEAMEGRPQSPGRRRSRDPVDPQVGSFEPGTDALERLVAAAAARLAGLTDAIEKNARASP